MSIVISGLTVSLGDVDVVHDVSTEVGTGRWLGLIGPNGAGKSTVLRAIVGTIDYRGLITIAGLTGIHRDRRLSARTVAYVPQRPRLPSAMTVREYVMLGRTPHLGVFAQEGHRDLRVTEDVLERLELTAFRDRPLGEISGGEAQRAVLGRALVQEAPVLVMDEPTTGLDLGHQEKVLELADELRRERHLTVICAMHDLTVAAQFCDKLTLLDHGHHIVSGPPNEVLTTSRLSAHFDASVQVLRGDSGDLIVAPRRRHQYSTESSDAPAKSSLV